MDQSWNIVVLGLSITSSWGNGHATVWRSLVRALTRRGHRVLFLERDVPWYAQNRDLPDPPFCRTALYRDVDELRRRFGDAVADADAVIVGSYVPEGVEVGAWAQRTARGVCAFYDIDTPVTLAKLARGDHEYISPELIAGYHLYLSFTGGPTLRRIERQYGCAMARPLYCCFDPDGYYPEYLNPSWDLGYMGTYSDDRQPRVERLLIEPARQWPQGRFAVAGPQYPRDIDWPDNVERFEHLPPARHRGFYNRQRFTLNITRDDMIEAGYSPSVRLFEAAACGTTIISDYWEGLNAFFEIDREILVARKTADALYYLRNMPDEQRHTIGLRARRKVLAHHTAAQRATELETYLDEALRGSGAAPAGGEAEPVETRSPQGDERVRRDVERLAPWFHNVHLPDGTQTAPEHFLGDFPRFKWRQIAEHLPQNLGGWRVLDIGCNAGFYSIELARRGAEVLGVDHDEHYLRQARWAASQFDLSDRVRFERRDVYELIDLRERFDLVLFLGVFYHLRYPLLGLDIVSRLVGRLMVFQTLTMPGREVVSDTGDRDINDREALRLPGWPKMAFIEDRLAGDPTNWWAPNHAGVEAMLRSTGMQVVGRPAHEMYLCEPVERIGEAALDPQLATAAAAALRA